MERLQFVCSQMVKSILKSAELTNLIVYSIKKYKIYKLKNLLLFLLFFFIFYSGYSQGKFQFYGKNDTKQKINFKLINNLIVIPLKINGKELSFILDTGVNRTILLNLTVNDSLGLKNIKKTQLKGLGNSEPVEALISKNNHFQIANIVNSNEDLYIVLKDNFNISSKMGEPIHGIIGSDLLKDVIVKIDYPNKVLTFYNPKKYTFKKCRKCEEVDLEFHRNKPYINAFIQLDTISNKKIKIKLLIDSGGSDALWLFEGTNKNIRTPKKYFEDVLGEGLSGTVYGNRSRIPEFRLGKFIIKKPTISFLDTSSTVHARKFKSRNGSIGGNILKRFKIWLDYPNKRIILKKNGFFKNGFYYNMSGVFVIYDGKEFVKEEVKATKLNSYDTRTENSSGNITIKFTTNYKYSFKPAYKINDIIKNSPGSKTGLKKEDVIKKINGKPSYNYTLDEINGLFSLKPGKNISIEIERKGKRHKFKFKLKQRI